MMQSRSVVVLIGLGLAIGSWSCSEVDPPAPRYAPKPPPLKDEPIGVQVVRAQPRLAETPFRVLLDFEKPVDMAFIWPSGFSLDFSAAHTGRSSLAMTGKRRELGIKMGSLLGGSFPGSWTLVGAYFRSDEAVKITGAYRDGADGPVLAQHSVDLKPGVWTGVWVDMGNAPKGASSAKSLQFTVEGKGKVLCDDVIVVNNDRVMERPATPESGWSIRQKGYNLVIDRVGRFRITAIGPEGAIDGWNCDEENEIRVRLVSVSGKNWVIYSDGRQYQDGKCGLLFNPSGAGFLKAFNEQHEKPGEVEVAEEFGRVERNTEGDKNNDGYNEVRGAYQFVAKGARFEVKLTPSSGPVIRPVLEIARMPAGKVLATMDGQLVEQTARLTDGTILVQLPTITRPTTVNVSIK